MWAILLDKTVEIDGQEREVYGLADFHCRPSRRGIGTHCLRAFEGIAKKDGKYCIIAFCDTSDIRDFYIKAGWDWCGVYEEKFVISSIRVEHKPIKPTERW